MEEVALPSARARSVSRGKITRSHTAPQLSKPSAKPALKSISAGWYEVAVISMVLALIAGSFPVVVEMNLSSVDVKNFLSPRSSLLRYVMLSFIGFIALFAPVPLTHCLAGRRKYTTYSLFQPFVGGTAYVVLQALAWTLYSITILVACYCLYLGYKEVQPMVGLITSTGIGSVISQVLVLMSLEYFDSTRRAEFAKLCSCKRTATPQRVAAVASFNRQFEPSVLSLVQKLLLDFCSLVFASAFFCFPIEGLAMVFIPMYAFGWPAICIEACLAVLYTFTYRNKPHRTGSRSWPFFRNNKFIFGMLERYFSFQLISPPTGLAQVSSAAVESSPSLVPASTSTTTSPPEVAATAHESPSTAVTSVPSQMSSSGRTPPHMFCFHPHGIYALTAVWSTRGPTWQERFPDVEVEACGATVMFLSPLLRDLVMWAGCREASREAMEHAVGEGKSVLLVPGGQREMRYTRSHTNTVTLVNRHKGFVKQAMRMGTPLVPMYAFGENDVLDNIRAPRLQEISTAMFGFSILHFPYGRWYSPVPRPVPITVVMGEPLHVPHVEHPSEELVDEYHRRYYEALVAVFEKHKVEAGHPNDKLVFSQR